VVEIEWVIYFDGEFFEIHSNASNIKSNRCPDLLWYDSKNETHRGKDLLL
jgi:hypothetical protein